MWHFVKAMHRPLMLDHFELPLALHAAQLANIYGATAHTGLHLVFGFRILQLQLKARFVCY